MQPGPDVDAVRVVDQVGPWIARCWSRTTPARTASVVIQSKRIGSRMPVSLRQRLAARPVVRWRNRIGKDLEAETLSAPGGEPVGHVFGYQGSPSWILVTVESPEAPGREARASPDPGCRSAIPRRLRRQVEAGGSALAP